MWTVGGGGTGEAAVSDEIETISSVSGKSMMLW